MEARRGGSCDEAGLPGRKECAPKSGVMPKDDVPPKDGVPPKDEVLLKDEVILEVSCVVDGESTCGVEKPKDKATFFLASREVCCAEEAFVSSSTDGVLKSCDSHFVCGASGGFKKDSSSSGGVMLLAVPLECIVLFYCVL